MSKKESVGLAQALDGLRIGICPDIRFGDGALKATEQCVIFRQKGDFPVAPTKELLNMSFFVRLAAIIASADGHVDESEKQYVHGFVHGADNLNEAEKMRLFATWEWAVTQGTKLKGIKAKISQLSFQQKELVCSLITGVAAADGIIHPGEVEMLQDIYSLLGRDPNQVPSDLHKMQSDSVISRNDFLEAKQNDGRSNDADSMQHNNELIKKIPTGHQLASDTLAGAIADKSPEIKNDKGPDNIPNRIIVNTELIKKKLAETAEVSDILAGVFIDDEPEDAKATAPEMNSANSLAAGGLLDNVHSLLLKQMIGRESITRSDFEEAAEQYSLMVDGAYEKINEASFDYFGEPVLEGDDPIDINTDALEAMIA